MSNEQNRTEQGIAKSYIFIFIRSFCLLFALASFGYFWNEYFVVNILNVMWQQMECKQQMSV